MQRRQPWKGSDAYSRLKDLYWLTPAGTEMSDQDWNTGCVVCFGIGLVGNQIAEADGQGERMPS